MSVPSIFFFIFVQLYLLIKDYPPAPSSYIDERDKLRI